MKAVLWKAYGPPDVLKLADISKPEPKPKQVRIRVHNTTAFPADCEMRRFDMPMALLWLPMRLLFGLFRPRGKRILGQEFAGTIDTVGAEVKGFQVGDEVFGCTGVEFGTYAEYLCVDENSGLANKPSNVEFADIVPAATGGANALHFLELADIKPGERILIYGAAGCIGSFAVQLAKHMGARVVAVDSGDKLSFLTELGADEVIDYRSQNPLNQQHYDVIFDVVGKLPFPYSLQNLTDKGRYVCANPRPSQLLWAIGKSVILTPAAPDKKLLTRLARLIAEGAVHAPIDKRFDLDDIVAAHSYVESGDKQGHVVIDVVG